MNLARRLPSAVWTALLISGCATAGSSPSGPRVPPLYPTVNSALIIGNDGHPDGPMNTAALGAQAVARSLEVAGLHDIRLQTNLGAAEMSSALERFISHVQARDGLAFVFFSGRVRARDGRQYWLPVAETAAASPPDDQPGPSLEAVLSGLNTRASGINVVIVQGCLAGPDAAPPAVERDLPLRTFLVETGCPDAGRNTARGLSAFVGGLTRRLRRLQRPVGELFDKVGQDQGLAVVAQTNLDPKTYLIPAPRAVTYDFSQESLSGDIMKPADALVRSERRLRHRDPICPATELPRIEQIPSPSATAVVPTALLGRSVRFVGTVGKHLEQALLRAGFRDLRYLGYGCRGFVLMADLECTDAQGTPMPGASRFYGPRGARPTSGLLEYLKGLFYAPPGYYRQILFVVTELPMPPSDTLPATGQLSAMAQRGSGVLPKHLAESFFTEAHQIRAYIYEFEVGPGEKQARALPPEDRRLTGSAHLTQAGIYEALDDS